MSASQDPYFPGTVDPAWATGDGADWPACSNPPGESCADAGCPVHGWSDGPPEYDPGAETADRARADIERDEATA